MKTTTKTAFVWTTIVVTYAASIGAYGPDTPAPIRLLACVLLFAAVRFLIYPKGELKR